MITGPILERWLLSGEAIHKNISIGGAGLTQLAVPEGKTFIVTKIEMLPFANIITPDEFFCANTSFYRTNFQDLTNILQRLQFQLLFYGLNTNSVYNIRNKFFLNVINDFEGTDRTAPGISFEKHSFETFHIVENNCWLFLKYFDFRNSATEITTDNYPLHFDGSQNWPPSPQYGYSDQSDITGYNPPAAPDGFNYLPQGLQQGSPINGTNQFILNSIEVSTLSTQDSAFLPPYADQSLENIDSSSLPSIPFYNISVIEINRRLSTQGLL
jgi:hypothetical protein